MFVFIVLSVQLLDEVPAIVVVRLLAGLVPSAKNMDGGIDYIDIQVKASLSRGLDGLLSDGVTSGCFPVDKGKVRKQQRVAVRLQFFFVNVQVKKHLPGYLADSV